MLLSDRYDLPLSTTSDRAAGCYIDGVDRLLSLNAGAGRSFEQAIAADDGFALAHAALALTAASEGRPEAAAVAVERAGTRARGISPREQGHLGAVTAVVAGDQARAIALIRAHLNAYPREALLLRHAGSLIAQSGRRDWPEAVCDLYAGQRDDYGDDWWFLGASAMYLQERNQFQAARRLAERSLAQNPRNAMGAHALAHVLYMTGDNAGVLRFLGGWMDGYELQAPLHCHLSWHLALAELAGGDARASLDRYARDIVPALRSRPQAALLDAASLLWRHELHGAADRPLPWGDVAAVAARAAAGPGFAFGDVHVAFALAAAGEHAAFGTLIDGLRRLAWMGHPTAGTVALPVALGVYAFAEGNYAEAVRLIGPVVDDAVRLGGSNAQREIFDQTLLEAYLRAGRIDQAEQLAHQRVTQPR